MQTNGKYLTENAFTIIVICLIIIYSNVHISQCGIVVVCVHKQF